MKKLSLIAAVLVAAVVVKAEETDSRALAGQKDFSKDYLERVTDERAADKIRREQARKDHDKYLNSIDRSK
jgi:hypothetical protein